MTASCSNLPDPVDPDKCSVPWAPAVLAYNQVRHVHCLTWKTQYKSTTAGLLPTSHYIFIPTWTITLGCQAKTVMKMQLLFIMTDCTSYWWIIGLNIYTYLYINWLKPISCRRLAGNPVTGSETSNTIYYHLVEISFSEKSEGPLLNQLIVVCYINFVWWSKDDLLYCIQEMWPIMKFGL